MVVCRTHFLTGLCPEASLVSLPHGYLHRASPSEQAVKISARKQEGKEKGTQEGHHHLLEPHLRSDTYHFSIFCSEGSHQAQPTVRNRTWHRHVSARTWDRRPCVLEACQPVLTRCCHQRLSLLRTFMFPMHPHTCNMSLSESWPRDQTQGDTVKQ